MSRRGLLAGGLAVAGAAAGCAGAARPVRTVLRRAGSRPAPQHPVGTDLLPQIDHIVVVMLENHSFDNLLGTLRRGDGFRLDRAGRPTDTNPDGAGRAVRAFHMPTPCQLAHQPSQSWSASHAQWDHGTNQGFVTSASGPVAMGYWTAADMPFTASLARTFPVGDRAFCSVLAQTYPNRRYLTAGTSLGLVDDTLPPGLPPAGTLFHLLNRHQISWRDYYTTVPSAFVWIDLLHDPAMTPHFAKLERFYDDCAAGTLPGFSLVDPDFVTDDEENPEDIQYGDVFLSQVVHAVMAGPAWSRTLLVWTYDEHGGYYDHVPPPAAPAPDAVAPRLKPGDPPGGFDRFGFRVPFGIVSPRARPDYVSHVVHDHTAVLKLVETKWNLPALTARDANAPDLLDSVDLHARPTFADPPRLAAPADPARRAGCERTGAGTIPPAGAVVAARG